MIDRDKYDFCISKKEKENADPLEIEPRSQAWKRRLQPLDHGQFLGSEAGMGSFDLFLLWRGD